MKIIYIADDGTQFDNEVDCTDYEWKLNHPNLKDIFIFDEDGNELKDIFEEDTYNNSMKIIVSTDEAVKDLQELAGYTGYCCYYNINKVGEWIFNKHDEMFVMI